MVLKKFYVILYFIIIVNDLYCIPIRYSHVDVLTDYSYIPSHLQNQLNFGDNTDSLFSCMYLCQNHDYCRTAVFDKLTMQCTLFEECSTIGRIINQIQSILISFLVCDGEPEYLAFSSPIKPVLLNTVLSNMINKTVLPIMTTYNVLMMGNYLYMPRDYSNYLKIYDVDTYTQLNNIIFPLSINGTYHRFDRTGTFCYLNPGGTTFTLYSSITGMLTTVITYQNALRICFSTTFVVTIRTNYVGADVYLRTTNNFSANYAYSIPLSTGVAPCIILNDQLLILISKVNANGQIQSTILNRTGYTPVISLTTPTSPPVIGRSTVNIDAAGRIYAQTNGSYALVIYSTSGQMLGRLPGIPWLEIAGKASKYKYRILTGAKIFEYEPFV